uniref:Uncharacterized protein n=1 Tax=Rangifer tarandus platyrhynchus TaxID=3082113 RepID=A0ACB0EMJ5_RANTA|nr:unnamed protein product [Rangifer tarandus platyrhynchus]
MKVSVQLAYKVPVLGPQDRRLLLAPRRFLPGGRELGAQGGAGTRAGPHLAGPHRRRDGGARSPRALCERSVSQMGGTCPAEGGGNVSEGAGASAAAVVVPQHVPTETPAGRPAPGFVQVAGLGLPQAPPCWGRQP